MKKLLIVTRMADPYEAALYVNAVKVIRIPTRELIILNRYNINDFVLIEDIVLIKILYFILLVYECLIM